MKVLVGFVFYWCNCLSLPNEWEFQGPQTIIFHDIPFKQPVTQTICRQIWHCSYHSRLMVSVQLKSISHVLMKIMIKFNWNMKERENVFCSLRIWTLGIYHSSGDSKYEILSSPCDTLMFCTSLPFYWRKINEVSLVHNSVILSGHGMNMRCLKCYFVINFFDAIL